VTSSTYGIVKNWPWNIFIASQTVLM
jgi:hypothetical protein